MHVIVTPVIAGLIALLYLYLSLNVSLVRRKAHVYLGEGGDERVLRAVRAHANFNEYVPLALILLMFLEMRAVSSYAIIALGVVLIVARILHALGISTPKKAGNSRAIGALLTLLVILITAVWLLVTYL